MPGPNSSAPSIERNLVTPQNLLNPFPLYKELREHDPVHWSEPIHAWFITRYDDVMEGYRDARLSADRAKLFEYQLQGKTDIIREFLQSIRHQMFMLDGPEHVRLRRQTVSGFSNQKLDAMRPSVQRITQELLDLVYAQGQMELVKDLAFPMPALAIAELLGIPVEDRARFRRWSEHFAAYSSPPVGSNP
ncbi:MAG: cytochrome P450, partial [Archangium sp.]